MRRLPAVLVVVAVALVATKLAAPANDHRSPCHSAHTCPSDHHSYVWLDAAEQGWDCAKPGAPELTSADTQAIFYGGLRYHCHRAGGAAAPVCGVERWAVKTLSDPAARHVDLVPRPTTVVALRRLAAPVDFGARLPGAEMHTWRIHVRLLWSKLEDDSDVHVVVADPATGATMIVELASPPARSAQWSLLGSAPRVPRSCARSASRGGRSPASRVMRRSTASASSTSCMHSAAARRTGSSSIPRSASPAFRRLSL